MVPQSALILILPILTPMVGTSLAAVLSQEHWPVWLNDALAWFCLLNGTQIWPWRGLAFTPVMFFYILVASRRPVIRELFASEPELLITGAAGVAAAWSIYATATMADLSAMVAVA